MTHPVHPPKSRQRPGRSGAPLPPVTGGSRQTAAPAPHGGTQAARKGPPMRKSGNRAVNAVVNALLSLLSFIVCFYALEAYFAHRHIDMHPSFRVDGLVEARKRNLPYDTGSRRNAVRFLRSRGIDAYPVVSINQFITSHRPLNSLFPLSGIGNVVTVGGNEMGYFWTYQSDRHGFNNPPEVHDNPVEIAFIGDSYTHGCHVREGGAADAVRERWPRTVNFGWGGTGTLAQLGIFREYVRPLQPEVVLLVWCDNDILNIKQEIKDPVLSAYYGNGAFSQDLLHRVGERNEKLKRLAERALNLVPPEEETLLYKIPRLRHLRFVLGRHIPALPDFLKVHRPNIRRDAGIQRMNIEPGPRPVPPHARPRASSYGNLRDRIRTDDDARAFAVEVMARILREVNGWGGRFLVVFFEGEDPYGIHDAVENAGIETLDVSGDLARAEENGVTVTPLSGSHFNGDGYRVMGEGIVRLLKEKGLNLTAAPPR